MKSYSFTDGIKDSVPIALGYLFVSFGFGIFAVEKNIPVLMTVVLSLTNLTSAGQTAAIGILAAAGGYIEMAAAQFIINIRYTFMGITMTQKFDESVQLPQRLLIACGITDEIFAMSTCKDGNVGKKYMYGLIIPPYFSWALGTLLGGLAGTFLNEDIKLAMGIILYGMFIAIIIPPARESIGVLFAVALAIGISCAITYLPVFSFIPSGFAIIICAVISAVTAALLFPKSKKEESEDE